MSKSLPCILKVFSTLTGKYLIVNKLSLKYKPEEILILDRKILKSNSKLPNGQYVFV